MHGLCKQLPILWGLYFSNDTVLANHAKQLGTTLEGINHVLNVTGISELYMEFFIREALGDHYMLGVVLKTIRTILYKFMEKISPSNTIGLTDEQKLNMTVYGVAANIVGGNETAYEAFFNEVKITGLDYYSRSYFAKQLHIIARDLKITTDEFLNGNMEELKETIQEMAGTLMRDASLPLALMLYRQQIKEPLKDLLNYSVMDLAVYVSNNTEEFIVVVYNISDNTRNIMNSATLQYIMSSKNLSLKRLSMLMIAALERLLSLSNSDLVKTYLGGVYIMKTKININEAMSILNFSKGDLSDWSVMEFHQNVFGMSDGELDQYFDGHVPVNVLEVYKTLTYGQVLHPSQNMTDLDFEDLDKLVIEEAVKEMSKFII